MGSRGSRIGGSSRGKSTTPVFGAVFMFLMKIAPPGRTLASTLASRLLISLSITLMHV